MTDSDRPTTDREFEVWESGRRRGIREGMVAARCGLLIAPEFTECPVTRIRCSCKGQCAVMQLRKAHYTMTGGG